MLSRVINHEELVITVGLLQSVKDRTVGVQLLLGEVILDDHLTSEIPSKEGKKTLIRQASSRDRSTILGEAIIIGADFIRVQVVHRLGHVHELVTTHPSVDYFLEKEIIVEHDLQETVKVISEVDRD